MYASQADVRDALDSGALLRLVDDEREGYTAAGELRAKQQARVTKALVDAGNEADTYIGQKYDLPLPSTPPVLRGKIVDITIWNLFARRGLAESDEVVRERYKNAIRWFEKLALGNVSLPLPLGGSGEGGDGGGTGGGTPQSGSASITAQPRRFTRDTMEGF